MDVSTPTVSPLRQRMIEDMRMRKFEPKTQAGYLRAVRKLAKFLGRSPDTASAEDLRSFQLHLVDERHLADHAQRDDHGPEVLLRRHARPWRVDGQDATRARAAHAAGGAQPRGGLASDRRGPQPQAPDGAVGGLRRRAARQRSHRAEGRRHRQPAHDAARGARQGPQGPLRHAPAGPAGAAARVVARGPRPGQDPAQRLAVPGPESDGPAEHPPAQPRHPRRRRRGQDRQARVDAHAAPQLCHAPAGAEGRHPRDPGAARPQASWRRPRSTRTWPPTCCAR